MEIPKIAIVMTCHNRRKTTLDCLRKVYAQAEINVTFSVDVYLTDDGCTDGTSEAARSEFPNINIIQGDGTLYWNRGMHKAFDAAMKGEYDFFLWLNDDTMLHDNAILHLLMTHKQLPDDIRHKSIVVGSISDVNGKSRVYGGVIRTHPWLFRYKNIFAEDVPVRCDSFCGNCVLLPKKVVQIVGNLDPVFVHGGGDLEYGLRAQKNGCLQYVATGFIGVCPPGSVCALHRGRIPLNKIFKAIRNPKGFPLRETFYLYRKYCGPFWFLIWLATYFKLILRSSLGIKIQSRNNN